MILSRSLCCSASIGTLLLAGAASAQSTTPPAPTPEEQATGLDEIVVTAQKRSESINSVGISISAATGEQLQALGVVSTADLVKVVPGFNFTPSAYGAPVYTLRGIGFYDTSLGAAPTVSVYVDEVPLPLSIMSTGATLDLQRVEVLKGPQGTLFGQNSTGGAINYIAAKPTDVFEAGVDATYGRFDRANLQGYLSGPLSDTLRARVAMRYDHSGDWQYSYTRDDERGRGDVLTARLLLDWTPTDQLSVAVNVNGWRDRSDNQGAQLVAVPNPAAPAAVRTYPLPPSNNRAADWDPDNAFRRDVEFFQTSVRANYAFSDAATLTSITSYETIDRANIVDADGSAIQDFAARTPGSSEDFSQELRLAGEIGRGKYVVGANYAHDDISDEGSPLSRVSSLPFSAARGVVHQEVQSRAVFANLDFAVTDAVSVQGGVRYTTENRDFDGCLYDSGTGDLAAIVSRTATARSGQTVVIAPGGCVTLGTNFLPGIQRDSLDEDNVSWRVGVNWTVAPRALLYANVSRGYKSGAYPTAGATFRAQFTPARQEYVTAYEAGFKLTLAERTLQLNGAGFYYDYRDKQLRGKVIDPVLGPLNALINVPQSRLIGGELQAIWQPTDGLTFNLGATYVESEIRGDFNNYDALAQLKNFNGQKLPLLPDWQINADIQYEVPLPNGFTGFAGANLNYQGATNGGLGEIAIFDIPDYALVDLRVGFKAPDEAWRLTGFVRNASDEHYWTLVNFPGTSSVIRYTGMPRTWGATLSYRY